MPQSSTSAGKTYTADESTLTQSNNQFSIKNIGVNSAQIAANAVTPAKIAGGNNSILPQAIEGYVNAVYNSITPTVGVKLPQTDNKIQILYKAASSLGYLWRNCTVIAGTWIQTGEASTSPLAYTFANSTSAQNDGYSFKIFIPKTGTYNISIRTTTAPTFGILTISIDGTSAATIDGYSAGIVRNVLKNASLGSIAEGEHTLAIELKTKNASSSSYASEIGQILIEET